MSIYDDLMQLKNAQAAQDAAQEERDNASAADMTKGVQMKYTFIDPKTGILKDQYKQKGGDQIAQALIEKQKIDESRGMDKAAVNSQAALANARSGMAMRGGLNPANAGNLARQNMSDSLKAAQSVAGQGMATRADINVKGAEMTQAADNNNIQQSLTQAGTENQFDLNKYMKNREVQAANQTARVTAAANDNAGGSWVCTEVDDIFTLSPADKFSLGRLNRYSVKNHPGITNMYLYDFEPLVNRMKETDNWSKNFLEIKEIISLVRQRKLEDAFKAYRAFIVEKVEMFWDECDHPEYLQLKKELA
jgi:hypothetical protein